MKILVCTDGSEQSQNALNKALIIAEGSNVNEVAIIHVDDEKIDFSAMPVGEGHVPTETEMKRFRKMQEEHKNERTKILDDAKKLFEEKNINARTIFKEGHPSHTIVETAHEEGFDMIVIGSRGLSGFKKVFLGSVSSAVVQEAKDCIVAVVK